MTGADHPGDLNDRKARLRSEARTARAAVTDRAAAAAALVDRFRDSKWSAVSSATVVAGYWPIRDEIDCRPLLRYLKDEGARVVLPAVEARDAPLTFRLWEECEPMRKDLMNMSAPAPHAIPVVPNLLLVPLLLVDRSGHRLGYGGGYYDRTLQELRKSAGITALGLCFHVQLTEKLPRGVDDMTLDGVITEKSWNVFDGECGAAAG